MPWGPWTPSTQTSAAVGRREPFQAIGYVAESTDFTAMSVLLEAPFTRGLLEIDEANHLAAVAARPDFPMLPKWRKRVRSIG